MKILLATNNKAKIERFKRLIKTIDSNIELFSPSELGIEIINTKETGKTIMENAELKARSYLGKVDMPIFSNDTGFYVEGEGLIDAPKRKALEGLDENNLTEEEISKKLLKFWKGIASKYGGKVDAAWIEAFVLLYPDGNIDKSESRREIILTNQEFGIPHINFPVRALYYSKITNKPAVLHTEEDQIIELKPVIDAIKDILKKY